LKEANLATVKDRQGFKFVKGALQEMDLKPLLSGVTHVFHLAAQAGVRKSWGRDFDIYTRDNIEATQRLLEALAGVAIERFVYASSSSVYGDEVLLPMKEDAYLQPLSPYGVSKLAAEHLAHLYWANHGVPAVSLRYFTVYGPRQRPDMGFQRFFTAVQQGKPITVYGDGEQTRDFTFVADAVAATIAAGIQGVPGRVYNIGGGSRVTLNHVLDLISKVTGRPVSIQREPDQKGDMRHTYADTSAARRDLGFAPRVTLEEGLAQQYRWIVNA
jgi:UDP-glucose 4-epimerase